ncbi:MAG TPA: AraC family ligand binding domain-containing protein, partial [Opitutaceae bacterium]|nr:AraC family ligand binding domain-containing protein [Opitutaceae bacterium]
MRPLPSLPFSSVRLTSTAPYHYFHNAAWSWDHTLQDFDLWVVCRGSGELKIDGRPVAIEAPQVFLFLPGQRILGSKDPGVRLEILTLHFTTDAPATTAARRLASLNGLRLPHATFVADAFEQLIEIAQLDDPLARQQVSALAMFILGELSRLQQTRGRALVDERFAHLVRSIRHHPEHEWSIPQ